MRSSKKQLLASAALTATYLVAAASAWAQPVGGAPAAAPPPAPVEGSLAVGDRDIIVTATRRAERLENVAATVLAVSGPMLEQSGVNNIHDLAVVAPGVQISNFGIYSQPSIRGVSTVVAQLAQETNVSLYVDGFYNPDQLATNMDLAGVQDIQILKGPQGTLYGRNATGGAILITTKSPTNKFQAEANVKWKPRFNDKSASVFIGGPITNGIKFSFTGYWRQMDGYVKDINHFAPNVPIDNVTWTYSNPALEAKYGFKPKPSNWCNLQCGRRHGNNMDHFVNWYVRPKLVLEPIDDLKVTLGYVHSYINEPRTFNFTHNTFPSFTAATANGYPVTHANDKTSINFRPDGITKMDEGNAIVEWRIADHHTLTGRLAYRKQADFQLYDFDGTPADASSQRRFGTVAGGGNNLAINHRRTWVAQLDYSGRFGNLDVLSGFFWYDDKANNNNSLNDAAGVHGPQSQYGIYNTKAWAAYLDATYNFNDKLFITAGARYAHDQRKAFAYKVNGDGTVRPSDFQSCYRDGVLIPGIVAPTGFNANLDPLCTTGARKLKKNIVTPRVVVRYNLSQGTNIWGSVTKGFKASAINLAVPFNVLKPETAWSYEAGFKTARGRLRAEASVFYYTLKNNQINSFDATTTVVQTILVNAGGSKAYGLDADVSYRFPGDRFNLRANFEYLHARYTDFKGASNLTVGTNNRFTSVIGDWTGRRVIRAPDFSGSITGDYTMPLFGGKLMASMTASFSSRYAPTNASYQCAFHTAALVPVAGQGPGEIIGASYCNVGTSHKKKGLFEENGYILVNGRISWTDPSDHYTITGFIDNLTNERYLFLARASGNGGDYKLTAPRAAGIQLGVKF